LIVIYDGGITNADLITDIIAEADISVTIPNDLYIRHLNALYQLLYRDYIKSEDAVEIEGTPDLSAIVVNEGEDDVVFDDIVHLYRVCDGENYEIPKATAAYALTSENPCYYRDHDGSLVVANVDETDFVLIRRTRPALITAITDTAKVPLPPEFLQLAVAKLLGEIYKAANDDSLSAKWLGEYNSLLDDFKQWLYARSMTQMGG